MNTVSFAESQTQDMYNHILSNDHELLESAISSCTKDEQLRIFTDKDSHTEMGLLDFAIGMGNFKACTIMIFSLSRKILKEAVKREHSISSSFDQKFIQEYGGDKTFKKLSNRLAKAHYYSQIVLEYRDLEFENELSQSIFLYIRNGDLQRLESLVKTSGDQDLREALLARDQKRGANLIAFAAHIENLEVLDFFLLEIEDKLLKAIAIQKDQLGWTAFHHFALLGDNWMRYRLLKQKTGVNTKSITEFFCESPSMLKKYLQPEPARFSARSSHIYVVDEASDTEQCLTLEEFHNNYGELLTEKFQTFKFIPHAKAKFFKSHWATGRHLRNRNGEKLVLLDHHLLNLYQKKKEEGVALAFIRRTDEGEPIPETVQLGLGVKTRKQFEPGALVTLYGGEQFLPYHEFKEGSMYRAGRIDGRVHRAYGSMVLHSAPNAVFCHIDTLLGISILGLQAISSIPKNTSVCINYGIRYFVCLDILPYEIRPKARKEMEARLRRISFEERYLESFPLY